MSAIGLKRGGWRIAVVLPKVPSLPISLWSGRSVFEVPSPVGGSSINTTSPPCIGCWRLRTSFSLVAKSTFVRGTPKQRDDKDERKRVR